MKTKTIPAFLLAAIMLIALAACGTAKETVSTEQLFTEAEALLEKDREVDSVMFCNAYPADYNKAVTIGDIQYAPFTWEHPFTTVSELKDYLHQIYSDAYYAEREFDRMLSGDYAAYIDYEGQILMNISAGGGGGCQWQYGTLAFSGEENGVYSLSVQGATSYDDPVSLEFTLIEENSTMKLNSMLTTYA